MALLQSLLFGLAKRGIEWLANMAIRAWMLYKSINDRNKELDASVAAHKAIQKEINEQGGSPTDEQKKRLIDSARNIIRDNKL